MYDLFVVTVVHCKNRARILFMFVIAGKLILSLYELTAKNNFLNGIGWKFILFINSFNLINVKNRQKHDCLCGGKFTRVNKATHEKTKQHVQYILNNCNAINN